MPAKPAWCSKINDVIRELEGFPRPFVDRATVEFLLGVGRRRAQQIMAPCVTGRIGASGVVEREALIGHLKRLAGGEAGEYEVRRRRKVASLIDSLRKERIAQPRVLVEAPVRVVDQRFEDLPAGVQLERGRLSVEFQNAQEAIEKLLALAMAIGNDFDGFERKTRLQ